MLCRNANKAAKLRALMQKVAKKVLVISGMHRSNTSLLANMLRESGVNFGNALVAGSAGNPYGHFEQVEMVEFHERVLEENNSSWRPWRRREYTVSAERRSAIVDQVAQVPEGVVWGFKVPHAVLLLNFWISLPEAVFVLIFRDPFEVIYSAIRRIGNQIYYKPYFPLNMARTYTIYNSIIADFYEQNANRVCLLHNSLLLNDPDAAIAKVNKKLALGLSPTGSLDQLVDRKIKAMPHPGIAKYYAKIAAAVPSVRSAYSRLCDLNIDDTD